MKKKLIMLLLLTYSSVVLSAPEKKLTKAQEQWTGYQSCSAQLKNELELINCLSPYLSSKITRIEKSNLASLLIMEFSFSELRECQSEKDLIPMKKGKHEVFFCMDVLGHKSKLPGYVMMEMEKKAYRIKAVKFSF